MPAAFGSSSRRHAQRNQKDSARRRKEQRITVPLQAETPKAHGPHRVEEEPPADRRQPQGHAPQYGVEGEKMIAAYRRNDRHRQACVGHLHQRRKQPHQELQGQDHVQPRRQQAAAPICQIL